MNRLFDIGFEHAGHWHRLNGELSFDLKRHGSQTNVLYAFVVDGDVKYVGKTTQSLSKRLYGYKKPGTTQSTNIKNNSNLKIALSAGSAVDILVLPDNGLMHYGQFHLNLAAGLEDSIIYDLRPEWNGPPKEAVPIDDAVPVIDSFSIVVHKTYFSNGFFSVSVANAASFGADGEQIDIFCGKNPQPLIGSINRRSNATNAPRIMGGVGLRDWLQVNTEEMEELEVFVVSPNEIRLKASTG